MQNKIYIALGVLLIATIANCMENDISSTENLMTTSFLDFTEMLQVGISDFTTKKETKMIMKIDGIDIQFEQFLMNNAETRKPIGCIYVLTSFGEEQNLGVFRIVQFSTKIELHNNAIETSKKMQPIEQLILAIDNINVYILKEPTSLVRPHVQSFIKYFFAYLGDLQEWSDSQKHPPVNVIVNDCHEKHIIDLYKSGYTMYERLDFQYTDAVPHIFRDIKQQILKRYILENLHEQFGTKKYQSISIEKFVEEIELSKSHSVALILKEIFFYFTDTKSDDFIFLSKMVYNRGSHHRSKIGFNKTKNN